MLTEISVLDALTDLKDVCRQSREQRRDGLAVVVGAGISYVASGRCEEARWQGLLAAGIDRCKEIDPDIPAHDLHVLRDLAASDDTDMLLSAASFIEARLQRKPNETTHWLRATVGALPFSDDARPMLEAIGRLAPTILTTNYDGLLESATHRHPATALNLQTALGAPGDWVIHLHGYWDQAATVVLGHVAYHRVLRNDPIQSFLKTTAMGKSLLYVGVGAGIADPNFEALRTWITHELPTSPHSDYRVMLGGELEAGWRLHRTDRVRPVAYGASHDELPDFLIALADGDLGDIPQDPDHYRERRHPPPPTPPAPASQPELDAPPGGPPATVGVLDHAARAAGALAEAMAGMQRIGRLLEQLDHRTREPPGTDAWHEDDRAMLAEQMIAAVSAPARQLRDEAAATREACTGADAAIGLLNEALARADEPVRRHADRTIATIDQLAALTREALDAHAALRDELDARRAVTSRWRAAVEALDASAPALRAAGQTVEAWPTASA